MCGMHVVQYNGIVDVKSFVLLVKCVKTDLLRQIKLLFRRLLVNYSCNHAITFVLTLEQGSPTVLLDPVNVGIAVGISLLSFIQAEIYVIAYVLPV